MFFLHNGISFVCFVCFVYFWINIHWVINCPNPQANTDPRIWLVIIKGREPNLYLEMDRRVQILGEGGGGSKPPGRRFCFGLNVPIKVPSDVSSKVKLPFSLRYKGSVYLLWGLRLIIRKDNNVI